MRLRGRDRRAIFQRRDLGWRDVERLIDSQLVDVVRLDVVEPFGDADKHLMMKKPMMNDDKSMSSSSEPSTPPK